MAISKIPSAGFQDNVKFRNIIINGDMSIAQRGTSTASITSTSYNTVDRFKMIMSDGATWTQSQSTDVPTGQGFAKSLKMDCTTANTSLAGGSNLRLVQIIEGQNLQYLKKGTANAESTTLSFWVKSNKTGTYIVEFADKDNSRSISKSYTINSANTWEKKTITCDGDTTGSYSNDNGESLRLQFWLLAGSNYTSGTLQTSWGSQTTANRAVGQVNLGDNTANDWYITGVQLEAGEVASDFEFLPYDVNLRRCQRYFIRYNNDTSSFSSFASGRGGGSNNCAAVFHHPVQMRAKPTLSQNGLGTDDGYAYNGVTLGASYLTPDGGGHNFSSSSVGQGRGVVFRANGNSAHYVQFDVEL
jgi:hypothetical protein